jgi:hypothetical protein
MPPVIGLPPVAPAPRVAPDADTPPALVESGAPSELQPSALTTSARESMISVLRIVALSRRARGSGESCERASTPVTFAMATECEPITGRAHLSLSGAPDSSHSKMMGNATDPETPHV